MDSKLKNGNERTGTGLGRGPIYDEPMQRKSMTLPADMVSGLTEIGQGNFSEGVRIVYRRYVEETSQPQVE